MTGISAGGGQIWEYMTVAKRAGMIAGVVPIASGTKIFDISTGVLDPAYSTQFEAITTNIANHPGLGVYAVHNVADNQVNIGVSQGFVDGVNSKKTNGASLLSLTYNSPEPLPPTPHNAWKRAYDASRFEFNGLNMYQWLLSNQNPTATSALPITLSSFDAYAKGSAVDLNWNTASESNSAYFAVERSSNGQDWKEIGRVKASGNSATAKSYKFTDTAPLSGNNYYRLKMVDLDATFKMSEMRKVGMNGSDLEFSFGPNPVINEATIRISGNQRTRLNVTLTDLMGRTLKSMSFSKTENLLTQKINLADLPAGQYILSVKGDNINYTQRIMKR
jgi:hypothetical protein